LEGEVTNPSRKYTEIEGLSTHKNSRDIGSRTFLGNGRESSSRGGGGTRRELERRKKCGLEEELRLCVIFASAASASS